MPQRSMNIDGINSSKHPSNTSDPEMEKELKQIRRTLNFYKGSMYFVLVIICITAVCIAAVHLYHHSTKSHVPSDPVPLAIRHSVNFSVYYPNPAKLPTGYHLNTSSFSSNKLAVVYAVNYSTDQKLVFSVQQKPAVVAIQNFYAKHMPLHLTVNTDVGTAAIGVIGSQTVVSLPTNGNAWLLITAPLNINQTQLSQVLRSIRIAQ